MWSLSLEESGIKLKKKIYKHLIMISVSITQKKYRYYKNELQDT